MSADIDTIFQPRDPAQARVAEGSALGDCGGGRRRRDRAGIIWSNTGKSTATPLTNQPANDVSKVPPTVKLSPGAQRWRVASSRRQSRGSTCPRPTPSSPTSSSRASRSSRGTPATSRSIPYPVDAIKYAPMKIDFSYPKEAQIEVALLPKAGTGVKPQLFSWTWSSATASGSSTRWVRSRRRWCRTARRTTAPVSRGTPR